MKNKLINFIKGMFVGIANIIPGVSGGTIAVILGIFDDLIYALNNFTKDIKKNLSFVLPIMLGAIFSILAFSSLLEYCLANYSLPTSIFFVGLVCGSVPLIYKKSVEKGIKSSYVISMIISISVVILFSMLNNNTNQLVDNAISLSVLIKIFLGGLLAAMAMIIPGISGSFVMILLGIYPTVIHSISNISKCLFDLSNTNLIISTLATIISLGLGVILGILIISKLISFLMDKYYSITYFIILGLVIGSVYGIFSTPITYQSGVNTISIIMSIITFCIGSATAYILGDKN